MSAHRRLGNWSPIEPGRTLAARITPRQRPAWMEKVSTFDDQLHAFAEILGYTEEDTRTTPLFTSLAARAPF